MGLLPFVLLLSQAGAKPSAPKPADVPPNLAAYLKLHPAETGLAVEPENRSPVKTGSGLAHYNRKRVTVGGLVALVPLEMPVFDDTLAGPPNLYDGLPREAKVLYLLSTLRPDQIDKAAHAGLGIGDLQGEQRDVFASLLPKSVKWTKQRLNKEASWGEEVAKGEMSEAQIGGMRLRVERSLQLEIPLVERPNSYTWHGADEEHGRPGDVVLIRNTDDEYERKDSFGIAIRKSVPNTPKKGQMDTSVLNAVVTVPLGATVGEAIAIAGRATGREILTDVRVRDRKLYFPAGKARAGDLLDALAYALQATYRRVGSAFMLVSDVTGLGARKLRLSIWENDLQLQLEQKKAAWRKGLLNSGAVRTIGYDEASGLVPNAAMLKSHEARYSGTGEQWASTADFPAEVRAFLDRVNLRYSTQKVDTNRARANWELRYRFVTADGEAFQTESGQLGSSFEFEPPRGVTRRETLGVTPKPALDPASAAGLCVVARTPDEVQTAVSLARRYGFAELWLDTIRPETLRAALGTGFPVRLVVRPWTAPPGTDPSLLDRSILGDTASTAAARIDRSEAAVRPPAGAERSGWERDPLDKDSVDLLSPLAPGLPARWAAFQALAATPGLKGVVVLGTQPRGYEAGVLDRDMGPERRELVDAAAMGYTEAARLAFARKWSLDPIDLADRGIYFSADLRPTLFLDDALRGSWTVYDGSQEPLPIMTELPKEWTKTLGALNSAATETLLKGIPGPTVWVESRRARRIDERGGIASLVPWKSGDPLPTFGGQGGFKEDSHPLVALPADETESHGQSFGERLGYIVRAKGIAFDLGYLPASAWDRRLNRWLSPQPAPGP